MGYSLFSFNGPSGTDQSQAPGLQQYMTQGQLGINPGQVQVAASDPLSAFGKMDFSGALKNAFSNGPPALQGQPGAMMGSTNQGLFDTVPQMGQNQNNPQATPAAPQRSMSQQLGDYLSKMFGK